MSALGKELLSIAEAVSNAKGVKAEVVLEAIQLALETATSKRFGKDIGVRVALDSKTGDYETFRYWDVVADEDLEFPDRQLSLEQAQAQAQAQEADPKVAIGERLEEAMESIEFGRIAAQTAKQVIMQKVREAERQLVVEEYEERVGQLVTGTVKRTTRDNIILELGANAEALLSRNDMLPNEIFRPGDRVRAYLFKVTPQARGAQLFVSRTHPDMLVELFRIEVPEIGEDVIQVKAAARDPGQRAKIAVKTNDGRIDPVGACVGMRGSRVQAVSTELAGERVDIILWDDNPAQLVINAMSPAQVTSIIVDEDKHEMDLAVAKEFLSQAIGRNGQNVKLASGLSGWTLNVMSEEDFSEKGRSETENINVLFTEQLDVEDEVAQALVDIGFSSLEEIAYVPKDEFMAAGVFDEETVDELRNRANDVLLTKALSSEEELNVEPAQDLLEMEGMERHIAYLLAAKGIVTMEDLAEQSVDELADIEGLSEEKAAELIMKAREPWFNEANS